MKTREWIQKMKEKTSDELRKELSELKVEKYQISIDAKIGKTEKTGDIRGKRKAIARILTEVNQRNSNNN